MTINRHPLQTLGAGESARQLPDEAVASYCDTLGERLTTFSKALTEEQKSGRLSAAATKATDAFIREMRATLMVMALKHGRQVLDVEPVPMTIDPTESGMPSFKDFWTLREDSAQAQQQLTELPTRDDLLEKALETIYTGRRPIKQQILWLQRAYMERLAVTPVVADFRQQPPVRIGNQQNDALYAVSWMGVVRSVNLFECTTLQFVERGGWHITGGTHELRDLVDTLSVGRQSLQEIIGLVNEAAWIVPQAIERVTLGPYHHRWTENDALVQATFAAALNDEPFILRCTIERAAVMRAGKRSTMDTLFGREPMEAGPTLHHNVLLVPLALKQQLGDADEDGQTAIVYGVSGDGDLVC